MATTYSIDVAHVQAVKQDILNSGNKIDTELDKLNTNLKTYLDRDWTGADRDAYTAYQTKWDGLIAE